MEDHLIDLEQADDFAESVNSIFRAAHTIKGSAGLFGLDAIVDFTHVVESVLNRARSNEIALHDHLVNLLLQCKDYMGRQIESISEGHVVLDAGETARGNALAADLSTYLDAAIPNDKVTSTTSAVPAAESAAVTNRVPARESATAANENWHISVHFGRDALRNGMDPLSFLRYLRTLGTIEHIVTVMQAMPEAEAMDPESCYLGYEINFNSKADKHTIEGVFEFVREDCVLQIFPPHAKVSEFLRVIDSLDAGDLRLGEMLVTCGTLTQRELDVILATQQVATDSDVPPRRIGEIVVDEGLASPDVVVAALNKQVQGKKAKAMQSQSVRVDAEKLDRLINLIGELVIAGAGVESGARAAALGSLLESTHTLTRLVEEVREGALNLRMVQIGETFNRFQRVVRDVSRELGKEIELVISSADTELDKTVVEKISDPLMHLVRNSIDHGIEAPELRAQRGKPETGRVHLNAFHESGSIVIEVSDDGGGLDRARILAKARSQGLVAPNEEPPEHELFQLIFEAGFSTAAQVSNISGRGVGMDVVRRNIEALRGSIEIHSEAMRGTTMRIRLPLTMAIIDGFMMRVGTASYVVPLDIVEECMELNVNDQLSHDGRNYINLRGEVLPFIRLGQHFQQQAANAKRENIVVLKYGNNKAGLVVDELLGEFQTVIKPLGSLFDRLAGISGSTILGSGEVALILDAQALIQHAIHRDGRAVFANPRNVTLH
jgi:two-component system chemotaxis sensor kinase CheA